MKRKVIQIAGSTQLVSLPRQWAKAHNIQKGAEIDVQEDGNRIIISADNAPQLETAEVNISRLGNMIHRVLGAYYRAGIDELKVTYDDPKLVEAVYDSLNRETMVGFEVLEQGNNFCILKNVSGETEEFNSVLRRVFALLLNMSDECLRMIKENKFDLISTLSFLEKSNNRFTTICRRALNKTPALSRQMAVGPVYLIVGGLENVADEYKYIAQHYSNLASKKVTFDKDAILAFEKANSMVRSFYEVFYKPDMEKVGSLKETRNQVIQEAHKVFSKKVSYIDIWLTHHAIMLATLIFNMTGSFIINLIKEKKL